MQRVFVTIPIYLPERFHRMLRGLNHRFRQYRGGVARDVSLVGDRDIEWSWVGSQLPPAAGTALDFGPGGSSLGLLAAQAGFDVLSIDLEVNQAPYVHHRLRFVQGDLLNISLAAASFDLVINCSTVEHVGLRGRYGVTLSQTEGDIKAMARLKELMKPTAKMILTIPVGRDAVFPPFHRIYGSQRLPQLLHGYNIDKEAYWFKNNQNKWMECDKAVALTFEAHEGSKPIGYKLYALGCFILTPQRE